MQNIMLTIFANGKVKVNWVVPREILPRFLNDSLTNKIVTSLKANLDHLWTRVALPVLVV